MVRLVSVVVMMLLLTDDWKTAVPDYPWSFPRDHWAHDGYRTEWWYFTGHLEAEGDSSRRFGYQFTFFRIGVLSEPLELDSDWAATSVIMGHAAITDLTSKTHVFAEVLYRETPLLAGFSSYPEKRIGWSRAPAGTKGRWSLDWNGDGFDIAARDDSSRMGFRLELRAAKPLVFQGPNGFSRKGEAAGAASLYYSYTRLRTSGELVSEGARFLVVGESWMDKEFSSSQLGDDQVGWDWFSLQLDDGRELMLYLMRTVDGTTDHANGTIVAPDGTARYLSRDEFTVEVQDHWLSRETEAMYPSAWRVRVASEELDLEVRALVGDQENRSRLPRGVYYWEGAVSVSGRDDTTDGRGFVELTGYGDGNRPPV